MPATPETLDKVAESLGEKVRRLRERHHLTQEQLAEKTGMSRNQIQNIERSRNNTRDPESGRPGRGNPRLETIYHLADVLGVKPAVLIDPDIELPEWEPEDGPRDRARRKGRRSAAPRNS